MMLFLVFLALVFLVFVAVITAVSILYDIQDISISDQIALACLKLELYKMLYDMSDEHGFKHAITVAQHALNATKESHYDRKYIYLRVVLASLLHDVDKSEIQTENQYIYPNEQYPNARRLLTRYFPSHTGNVLTMIYITSHSISYHPDDSPWYYYPLWANSLESVGLIGIKRAIAYTRSTQSPWVTPDTPRPKTLHELYEIPMDERFKQYSHGKKSESMIDHFYDKLIPITNIVTNNTYFDRLFKERRHVMEEFILEFGKTGNIPFEYEMFES